MKPRHDFTPNAPTMAAIWLLSWFLWRAELRFCYNEIGGGLGVFVLSILFISTPFVLWWIIGRIVFLIYRKRA